MGKGNSAMVSSPWTTGAAIAIGTNIDVGGILVGGDATVTLLVGTQTIVSLKVASDFGGAPIITPFGISGPVEATSSGSSFSVLYRARAS